MIESKTPITDSKSVIFNAGTEDQPEPFEVVEASDMRALELTANAMRDALAARQWVQYVDAEGEVWAACSDCLQSPEEGHAPTCETAAALANLATLQPSPHDAPRTA